MRQSGAERSDSTALAAAQEWLDEQRARGVQVDKRELVFRQSDSLRESGLLQKAPGHKVRRRELCRHHASPRAGLHAASLWMTADGRRE